MNAQTDWRKHVTPGNALKWGGVVFAYCIAILLVVSIILAMVGVYD